MRDIDANEPEVILLISSGWRHAGNDRWVLDSQKSQQNFLTLL